MSTSRRDSVVYRLPDLLSGKVLNQLTLKSVREFQASVVYCVSKNMLDQMRLIKPMPLLPNLDDRFFAL